VLFFAFVFITKISFSRQKIRISLREAHFNATYNKLHGVGEGESLEAVIHAALVVPVGVIEQNALLLGPTAERRGGHDSTARRALKAPFEPETDARIAVTMPAARTI
jgi:hypothetical protein